MTCCAAEPEFFLMPDAPRGTTEHNAHVKVRKRPTTSTLGRRCGETHHWAKQPDSLVEEARRIHDEEGLGFRSVARELKARFDVTVPIWTVRHWCNGGSRLRL